MGAVQSFIFGEEEQKPQPPPPQDYCYTTIITGRPPQSYSSSSATPQSPSSRYGSSYQSPGYASSPPPPKASSPPPTKPNSPPPPAEPVDKLDLPTGYKGFAQWQSREVDYNLLDEKIKMEEQQNMFSEYYKETYYENQKVYKPITPVQKVLKSYKHADAIAFAACSHTWWPEPTPAKHRVRKGALQIDLKTFPQAPEHSIHAFYRVIAEKETSYILVACHSNVHGLHRGDLRFVEINSRSKAEGVNHSLIGQLFLGDLIAVTSLAKLSAKGQIGGNVTSKCQESECVWMVRFGRIIDRSFAGNCTFAILRNGAGVVKGHDEMMRVIPNGESCQKKIYNGKAFIPQKMLSDFTEEHRPVFKNILIARTSKLCTYPNATGTIYTYSVCKMQTKHFDVGTQAFKMNAKKEEKVKAVETCALMGFSAVNNVFNGRADCRGFPARDATRQGLMVRFFIDNPSRQPTEGLWRANNRIKFSGKAGNIKGVIETVVTEETGRRLRIMARISRQDASHEFNVEQHLYIVFQREAIDTQLIKDGFFDKLDPASNGRRIIKTLYGGKPIERPENVDLERTFVFPHVIKKVPLNKYQCEYVSLLLADTPLTIGSSPFGCGKSMTIVTAAIEMHKKTKKMQLLITQSNYASVNLVDIASRCYFEIGEVEPKFVRYVTENNWNELPENCRTPYDYPTVLERVAADWARGFCDNMEQANYRLERNNGTGKMINLMLFVINRNLVQPDELAGKAAKMYQRYKDQKRTPWPKELLDPFFDIYNPDIIMTTADSLQGLSKQLCGNEKKGKGRVSSVQIDEASQLPECTLLYLLKMFPEACFGLIGDTKQLPPYCEEEVISGKLKEFGIGNTMERAINEKLFPHATLRYIYRCHPEITDMLSDLFYDGVLISAVKETERNEFITKHSSWPNPNYPMMIMDNKGRGNRQGTSFTNIEEVHLVEKIVQILLTPSDGYRLMPKDIGVISFYAAQTSWLIDRMRGSGVKCGTVDAFQGSEREVMILCCTNEKPSEFMLLANRLNVALSRARQATIIIGNVEGLRNATFFKDIVKAVEHRGCISMSPAGDGGRRGRGRGGAN